MSNNPVATQIRKNNITTDLNDARLPHLFGEAGQVLKMNEQGTAIEWGVAGTGDVKDVKVNGTSVVDTNKVALIDLTGKEDISNKVTLITGNESSTTLYPTTSAIADYAAPLVHNHDGRYYTESEVNALLAGKSQVSVSSSGTSTDTVNYITIDGTEKKLSGVTIDNHTLITQNGITKVNTTDEVEESNDLPITSSGVLVVVGNINTLLSLI